MKAMACRACGTRIPGDSIRCPYCYRFQWRGIGMAALIIVVFLSAASGAAWLMIGPRPDTANLPAEMQPEAITPFESGSTSPQADESVQQESEMPPPGLPGMVPVEKKRTGLAPTADSPPAPQASPPVKAGDYPSNASQKETAAEDPQKQKKRTEDTAVETSGPRRLSGEGAAPAQPEQAPARAARTPVTNALAGPGPEKKESPANGVEGPETGPETPQP